MEDLEILELVKNGDTGAFSHIIERYHRQLLGFIYRIVGREDVVEDIGQEVFLSIYQSLENFDANRGVPFSAWLFLIARNRCISELRRYMTRKEEQISDDYPAPDKTASPDKRLEEKERRNALRSAIDGLEEPFRSTLMAALAGQTIENLAHDGDISRNTVKTRLFRAREKLKKILNAKYRGSES